MANELIDDSCSLVELYLETDPELAHIAKETASIDLPDDIPISLSKEDQMEA
jgi:hypothetical protein